MVHITAKGEEEYKIWRLARTHHACNPSIIMTIEDFWCVWSMQGPLVFAKLGRQMVWVAPDSLPDVITIRQIVHGCPATRQHCLNMQCREPSNSLVVITTSYSAPSVHTNVMAKTSWYIDCFLPHYCSKVNTRIIVYFILHHHIICTLYYL